MTFTGINIDKRFTAIMYKEQIRYLQFYAIRSSCQLEWMLTNLLVVVVRLGLRYLAPVEADHHR